MMIDDLRDMPLMCTAEGQEQETSERISSERKTRSLIFHLLYAAYAHDFAVSVESLIDVFNRGFDCCLQSDGIERHVVAAIIAQRAQLDMYLVPLLNNWRLDRIGVCTHLILWYALWELHNAHTDPKIVINEAIELAKCFAEKDAYRFVNGVLDQAMKRIKPISDEV